MAWAGWLFDFYDLMLFSFLLVPIQKSLHLAPAALSLLLGASLAATALGGVLFGWLADRYGRNTDAAPVLPGFQPAEPEVLAGPLRGRVYRKR